MKKTFEYIAIAVFAIHVIASICLKNAYATIGFSICTLLILIIVFTEQNKKFYNFFKKPKQLTKHHNYNLLEIVAFEEANGILEYYGVTYGRYKEIVIKCWPINKEVTKTELFDNLAKECTCDNELFVTLFIIGYEMGKEDVLDIKFNNNPFNKDL